MNRTATFNQILRRKGLILDSFSAILVFFYTVLFIALPLEDLKWSLIIEAGVMITTVFIITPIENFFFTRGLTDSIEYWQSAKETTEDFRTKLFTAIARFPLQKGTITFCTFTFAAIIILSSLLLIPYVHITFRVVFIAFAAFLLGAQIAALIAFNYTEIICSKYCEDLVMQGIDKEFAEEKKHFGMTITLRCIMYLIVPMMLIFMIVLFDTQLKNVSSLEICYSSITQIPRAVVITFLNIILYTILAYLFYKKIKNSASTLANAIEEVLEAGNHSLYIKTNIFDSMQYSIFVLNEIIANYSKLIEKSQSIGQEVLKTTEQVSAIARNLEETSTEQNADVQEISATMEDTNDSLKDIDTKLSSISSAIDSANKEVTVGFDIMKQNIIQMDMIQNSNKTILNGINNLADHIQMIENIINLINDIAEQTRIIAFNAELEAVGAGSNGKNFHIIAAEIRRLANSIVDSIMDIKIHTDDIQKATQMLTELSNSTTGFISEEHDIAQKLESHFHNIQISTDETANQAAEISSTVSQQAAAFNQIVITLNQISSSIQSFSVSTKDISNIATQIQKSAMRINSLH